MDVGRKRKDGNPLGLEPRVEWHHGQFRYLHRDGSKEKLGADVDKANETARLYNDKTGRYGTIGYWLDRHNAEAKAGRLHKKRAPRTIEDDKIDAGYLKAAFEETYPRDLVEKPSLIADYRDNRVNEKGLGRIRANREMSLLSTVYSWLIEKGLVPGLNVNPVKLIARNPEKAKDRYVEDGEYRPVYSIAQRSVCMALRLAYATLQRPEDILALPPSPVRVKAVAGKETSVLTVMQGKTGRSGQPARSVDIEMTPELEEIVAMLRNPEDKVIKLPTALVHDLAGKPYTIDGIGAMVRRYCGRAGVKTFGLMDVRAKGATDMFIRGVPLEVIQRLMAHKSVTTTEIYIKRMMATCSTVRPNSVAVGN